MTRDTRLAVYGTLAPGEENHGQLDGLTGSWSPGAIRGRIVATSWGEYIGYPALVLDRDAGEIALQVFASPDLPAHWQRLDTFETEAYRRTPVEVETPAGLVAAWIYLSAGDQPDS